MKKIIIAVLVFVPTLLLSGCYVTANPNTGYYNSGYYPNYSYYSGYYPGYSYSGLGLGLGSLGLGYWGGRGFYRGWHGSNWHGGWHRTGWHGGGWHKGGWGGWHRGRGHWR
ncbi:hypothetical protein [Legionella sp. WA2024007413]